MINFNKFYKLFNIISLVLILFSISLLLIKGLNFGVDFKGGTLIELRTTDKEINISTLRSSLNKMNLGDVNVKKFGNEKDFLIKFEIEGKIFLKVNLINLFFILNRVVPLLVGLYSNDFNNIFYAYIGLQIIQLIIFLYWSKKVKIFFNYSDVSIGYLKKIIKNSLRYYQSFFLPSCVVTIFP